MNSKAIVIQFYQALTRGGDTDAALDYLADEISWRAAHPINGLHGKQQFLQAYWQPLKAALPDIEYRPFIMLAGEHDGQQWVDSCGYFIGTFKRPLLGIRPTGKTLYLRYADMLRIEHGKISACHIILDFIAAMQQAGVRPTRPQLKLAQHELVLPPAGMDGLAPSNATAEENEKSLRLVDTMLAGLARYDGQSLSSMGQEKYWHADFMWYGPAGIGSTRGLSGFRSYHQGPFLRGFPDRSVGDHLNTIAEGRYAATGGWPHMSATHTGDGWLGLPATNRKVSMRVMDFWLREGERLAENWVSIDIVHILLQLGHDLFQQLRSGHCYK